jgi:hypothetical protein
LPTLVAPVSVPPTLNIETYQVTHPGPTDTQINWIDLFPAGFNNIGRTSVHTDITLAPLQEPGSSLRSRQPTVLFHTAGFAQHIKGCMHGIY